MATTGPSMFRNAMVIPTAPRAIESSLGCSSPRLAMASATPRIDSRIDSPIGAAAWISSTKASATALIVERTIGQASST